MVIMRAKGVRVDVAPFMTMAFPAETREYVVPDILMGCPPAIRVWLRPMKPGRAVVVAGSGEICGLSGIAPLLIVAGFVGTCGEEVLGTAGIWVVVPGMACCGV
jgi:hypothetical protein